METERNGKEAEYNLVVRIVKDTISDRERSNKLYSQAYDNACDIADRIFSKEYTVAKDGSLLEGHLPYLPYRLTSLVVSRSTFGELISIDRYLSDGNPGRICRPSHVTLGYMPSDQVHDFVVAEEGSQMYLLDKRISFEALSDEENGVIA